MIDVDGLLETGRSSRLRVGIGLPAPQASKLARRLVAIGCGVELAGFRDEDGLVSALADGEIQAAIRGVLNSAGALAELKGAFSLKEVMRAAVLEESGGKKFLLAPVGIDEGCDGRSRLSLAKATVKYFSAAGWNVSCGVLSKGRLGDAGRGEGIRASLRDGRMIVKGLRSGGIEAKHFEILIEDAVKASDLILAPDGVSGNMIFRTLHFLGSCRAYGAPVVNMDRVFVDTSRAKADFSDSVLLAAGLAEVRRRPGKRA